MFLQDRKTVFARQNEEFIWKYVSTDTVFAVIIWQIEKTVFHKPEKEFLLGGMWSFWLKIGFHIVSIMVSICKKLWIKEYYFT